MRFGSVCSGIEAASAAWHPLGWQAAWFSEIEPFPCAVLAHHYPEVPNHGDMTALPQLIRSGKVEAPDLFCGGTPCQAFSVAGLRRSLDDERGNLSLTFVEIADAIDDVRRARGDAECIVFWENVPGVLSTRDNAFGCFLGALAGCDTAIEPLAATGWTDAGVVAGPQRTVAWRVLDAQYFGLAQRRKRVFVVASARDHFDPAAVLLEFDGVRRDTAPSREAREVAPTIPARSTGGGGLGTDFDLDGGVIRHCGFCRNFFDKYRCNAPDECDCPRCQGMCECHTMTASTYCIKGAAIGRKPEAGPQHGEVLEEACYTLNCVDQHAVAMCLNAKGGTGRLDAESETFIAHTMQGSKGNAVAQADGPSFTLNAMHGHDVHAIAVPVGVTLHGTDGTQSVASFTDLSSSLRSRIPSGVENSTTTAVLQATAVAFDAYNQAAAPVTHTLRKGRSATGDEIPIAFQAMQVRRLTPVECERLQGFPDGYTAIPWRGKPASECPDGPRYKALGNSWAVPVVRWIGRRIAAQIA